MAWYNSSWLKRKAITLTGGASGAQTDYQVKLTVTYDSDMQSDFDDLRFTKADGTTLLDAWMESYTVSTSATVWVETDTPANTVEADIYMYYDNSGASSDWDIQDTMLDGDDFLGSSLDTAIWNTQDCAVSVGSGELTLSSFTSAHSRYAGGVLGKILIDASSVVEVRLKSVYTDDGVQSGLSNNYDLQTDDFFGVLLAYNNLDYGWQYNEGNHAGTSSISWAADTYYRYRNENYGTGVKSYRDDVERTGSPLTTNVPNEQMYLSIGGDALHSPTIKVDWIFARKYVANPATYEFGSEETAGGPRCRVLFGPFCGPFRGVIG